MSSPLLTLPTLPSLAHPSPPWPLPAEAHDLAALQPPAAYAAAVDQISRTVQQLLLAALAGAQRPAPAEAATAAEPAMPSRLSVRECEVLARIAAGDSNKAIARTLALSPHTVKRHVANILDKLDLRTRGQAAAWWAARQTPRSGH
jgi:LuxR family transcriptional regulator, maltose regulon positive regulatory protein